MDMRVGPQRRLSTKELMLLNYGAGEDSWESLGNKEIKPVNPKGNQPWIFFRRTAAEAEAPIFWPPDVKNWLIGIEPNAGKDWRQKEKRVEMIRWLDSITNSVDIILSKLQETASLLWCSAWGRRVRQDSATEQQQNWLRLVVSASEKKETLLSFPPLTFTITIPG